MFRVFSGRRWRADHLQRCVGELLIRLNIGFFGVRDVLRFIGTRHRDEHTRQRAQEYDESNDKRYGHNLRGRAKRG